MPRKLQEKTIKGTRYRVQQLGATKGGELIFRMAIPLLSLVGSSKLSQDAMRIISQALSPADFNWALDLFKDCTTIYVVDVHASPNGKTGAQPAKWLPLTMFYDDHFAGDYGAWFEWLQFVAEVNFGDFFAAPKEQGGDAPGATASSPSPSPPESTGSPGESSPTPE
jgi:hypothetical protein